MVASRQSIKFQIMPVRIRLALWGRKHMPFYRIVAADSRYPRDGRHLEIVRFYLSLNVENKERNIFDIDIVFLVGNVQSHRSTGWSKGASY